MPSMISYLKNRLKNRTDSEHEQALLRITILAIIWVYFFWFQPESTFTLIYLDTLASLYLLVSVLIFLTILIWPERNIYRRCIGIAGDLSLNSLAIYVGGESAVFLLGLYFWVMVGNGFRYGFRYLIFASLLALAGFITAAIESSFWMEHRSIMASMILLLVLVPGYLAIMLKRLEKASQKLAEMNQGLEVMVADRTKERTEINSVLLAEMEGHKKTHKKWLHAQKMETLGTLVGGIAHDFNNILGGMFGVLHLAKDEMQKNQQLTKRWEALDGLSRRAAGIVNQLLIYARKDAVETSIFRLNQLVKNCVDVFKAAIPENIDFKINVCEECFWVQSDRSQIEQVLMNLISNAVDAVAHATQPKIRLEVKSFTADDLFHHEHSNLAQDHFALISVIDNGEGIKEEDIDQVFDPFFTTKDVGKGTGLGLSMVYGSIRSLGGCIRVESKRETMTAFHIYLPILLKVEEGQNDEDASGQIIHGKEETVLLVDDEEQALEIWSEVLRKLNYQVLIAHNGQQAVEIFSSHPGSIDLVIMDVVMPVMGGVEAAKAIREFRKNVNMVFATGYDLQGNLEGQTGIKNEVLLHKPYSICEVSRVLHEQISRQ